MPPVALMAAAYMSSVFFSGSPRNEAGPVTDSTAPILTSARTSPAAMTIVRLKPAAATRPRAVLAIVSSRTGIRGLQSVPRFLPLGRRRSTVVPRDGQRVLARPAIALQAFAFAAVR